MKRREKILIIVSALALIFLVIYKFSGPDKQQVPVKVDDTPLSSTDQFVAQQQEILKNIKQQDADEMIIKKAFVNWDNDPFASADLLKLMEDKTQVEKFSLFGNKEEIEPIIYSGYLKVGKKVLAIINGMEYEKGDTVEETYYKIISISTDSIKVSMPDSVLKTIRIEDGLGSLARNEIGI